MHWKTLNCMHVYCLYKVPRVLTGAYKYLQIEYAM